MHIPIELHTTGLGIKCSHSRTNSDKVKANKLHKSLVCGKINQASSLIFVSSSSSCLHVLSNIYKFCFVNVNDLFRQRHRYTNAEITMLHIVNVVYWNSNRYYRGQKIDTNNNDIYINKKSCRSCILMSAQCAAGCVYFSSTMFRRIQLLV